MYRLLLSIAITVLLVAGCSNADNNDNNAVNNSNNDNAANENAAQDNNDNADNNNAAENNNTTDSSGTTEYENAEEILAEDPDADIFQFEGVVYMTNIPEVEGLELTVEKPVGKIESKYSDSDAEFEDGMSTKLVPGVKFYDSKEESDDYLLAEMQGDIIIYYAVTK